MIAQLSSTQADQYLRDRASKGFNSVLVNLIEHQYASNAPANFYGDYPFTNYLDGGRWDMTSMNEAYFTNADWMIKRAAYYGIQVILVPAYCGYQSGSQGWYQDMASNGTNNLAIWGQYVGKRYKDFPNIIWLNGGDDNAPDLSLVDAVANGIRVYDTNHLQTAEGGRGTSALDYYPEPWDQINTSYTGVITYIDVLANYNGSPVTPDFLVESVYEGNDGADDSTCREEAYDAVFNGAMGHIFGNTYIWQFAGPWQQALSGPGSSTIQYLRTLMASRPWYSMAPDQAGAVVTLNPNDVSDGVMAPVLRATNGASILVYAPQSLTFTVNMAQVSGTNAQAWWYNPRDGSATNLGIFSTAGSRPFTTPDANDWVLVLDDASKGFDAPGLDHPPIANADTIERYSTEGVMVSAKSLLINDSDLDGDWLSVTQVQSLSSATVVQNGDWIIYTPAVGFNPLHDHFSYTVSDSRGGFATGTVTVNVVARAVLPANCLSIAPMAGGTIRATYHGNPNQTYGIQSSIGGISSSWQTIGTATADSLGNIIFETTASEVSSTYRMAYP